MENKTKQTRHSRAIDNKKKRKTSRYIDRKREEIASVKEFYEGVWPSAAARAVSL